MAAPDEAGWDEAALHAWLAERLPGIELGGAVRSHVHDAAVLPATAGPWAACVDRCEEGVHFLPEAEPAAAGAKAAGRALSDLAATAAEPRGLLLALAAPRGYPEARVRACIEGLIAFGAGRGAPLIGGDLTAHAGGLSLVVTALGEAPADPPGRDRGKAGDELLLTGAVGGSGLGRHLALEPRLATGRALYDAGLRTMMDVSDGLALDLSRLARLSGLVAELDALPLHPDAELAAAASGRSATDHGLHDGEDHELIAAGRPGDVAAFLDTPAAAGCQRIGRLRAPDPDEQPGLVLRLDASPRRFDPRDPRAFVHGR